MVEIRRIQFFAPGGGPPRPGPAGGGLGLGDRLVRALTVGLAVLVAIPVAALLLVVGLVMVGAFAVRGLWSSVRRRGWWPERDGRENVRVIRRDGPR